MAVTTLVNSRQNAVADTIESFYTSPSGTVITAFTATNNTDSNKTYKAYIYDVSGTELEAIIPLKIVIRSKTDLGSPIINQFIPQGGTLRIESSEADSISFRVSGREL